MTCTDTDTDVTEFSAQSLEYLHVPFTSNVDPDTVTVEIAIVTYGAIPDVGDWRPATIVDAEALILIGPGELELAVGFHDVWVRITDTPEIPVEIAGQIKITV